MCNLAVKEIFVVLFVCFAFVNTEVTLEKGGYSVLVSFSQNVKSTEGMFLLEKARESLEAASIILYNAVGRQFTKVTFKIPESWDISQLDINASISNVSRYTKADFLIDNTNDVVFGKFPFAQQYGSCGVPGHQIIIPTAFFSDANTFPKGTALAREWLKYRYGVFDENGYEKDILYPLYYVFPGEGERKVTDCTNSPVTYNFIDQGETFFSEDNELITPLNSRVVPDVASLENVTSSLMYFHQDIPEMQHICGKNSEHQHNALSPNKHNAMCRSQSVWDVMKKAEDFQTETATEKYSGIEFIYAQERKLKVVVAWENTLQVKKIKGNILNAIKRFIYELPQGAKFNGFPFSDTLSPEKDYSLKELNDMSDKNAIMAYIKSDFVAVSNGSLDIAISKALDILESDSELEGTIIAIAKSSEVPSVSLLERLQKVEVCVKILSLRESFVPDGIKNFTSVLPCGSQEDIFVNDNEDFMFNQLYESMESILPDTVDDKMTETVKTGYLSADSPITLHVDETVEEVTFWMFTDRESENFEMKFNQANEKLEDLKTSNIMALSFHPREAGDIEFAYPHETDPIFTQVRFTSKPGKYLNGLVFIQDTTEISSISQMPVIIYAIIRYGAYPVQNANVTAIVGRPNENGISLEMFDDGLGDPDITGNDGIYSRYFTQFSESGVYTVDVTVDITDLTSYGIDENAGYRPCCGSFMEAMSSKIPESYKVVRSTFTAKSGRPDGGYKPSRITDLRIDKVIDGKIVLKWSAPGEEGDFGTVQSYEIKLYTSHEDAMNGTNGNILNYEIPPLERGSNQILELNFSDFNEPGRYFLTISAKNAKETGDASTILEIFIPDKDSTTTAPDDETGGTNNDKSRGIEKKTALIIGLAVGLVVLIILIIFVVYFIVIKPQRKEEAKDQPTNPTSTTRERDENNVINPISFISADTLLRHHNEKALAKRQNKEPPIFREEDFEEAHSSQTSEPQDNNNTQQLEGRNKMLKNGEYLPPKSPKKTTYV